jgi:hypothetical protein
MPSDISYSTSTIPVATTTIGNAEDEKHFAYVDATNYGIEEQ